MAEFISVITLFHINLDQNQKTYKNGFNVIDIATKNKLRCDVEIISKHQFERRKHTLFKTPGITNFSPEKIQHLSFPFPHIYEETGQPITTTIDCSHILILSITQPSIGSKDVMISNYLSELNIAAIQSMLLLKLEKSIGTSYVVPKDIVFPSKNIEITLGAKRSVSFFSIRNRHTEEFKLCIPYYKAFSTFEDLQREGSVFIFYTQKFTELLSSIFNHRVNPTTSTSRILVRSINIFEVIVQSESVFHLETINFLQLCSLLEGLLAPQESGLQKTLSTLAVLIATNKEERRKLTKVLVGNKQSYRTARNDIAHGSESNFIDEDSYSVFKEYVSRVLIYLLTTDDYQQYNNHFNLIANLEKLKDSGFKSQ